MSTFKVSWNPTTKRVYVQPSTGSYPNGDVQLPNFIHEDAVNDKLGNILAHNHVLYHHVRDAMYMVGVYDMQSLRIEHSLIGGVGVAPNAPVVTKGASGGTTQVVSWAAPTVGTGPFTYQLQRRLGSSTGSYTNVGGTTSSLSATVTGLTENTAYDYKVIATNDFGTNEGLLNDANSGTVSQTPTTKPGVFIAPANANTVGTTAWLDGRIQFGTAGGKAGAFNTDTTSTTYGWYAALASAGSPVFTDVASSLTGGWISQGTVQYNGASWQLWRHEYMDATPTGSDWTVA